MELEQDAAVARIHGEDRAFAVDGVALLEWPERDEALRQAAFSTPSRGYPRGVPLRQPRGDRVMRQHFHRCQSLRVISVDSSELSGERKGASTVLDELCEVRNLARCVGLVDCDVLTDGQKRELLVARVTHLREEGGGATALGDLGGERGLEIQRLATELREERDQILADNRRRLAEATAAADSRADDTPLARPQELFSPDLRPEVPDLRTARLDAIDRAHEEMAHGSYGVCARCAALIEIERLRAAPDSHVCGSCAKEARALS